MDILVNNAGLWPTAFVKEMSRREWDHTVAVNLTGPFMLSQRMVRHLLATGRPGKIVNIVSQAAFQGATSGHAHYAAAKAGLVNLTVSLAREVAPHGILVNAVAPGMMETPMSADALASARGSLSGAHSRSAASPSPKRWRPWSSSWPPTKPAT